MTLDNNSGSQWAIARWLSMSALTLIPIILGLEIQEFRENQSILELQSSYRETFRQALLLFVAGACPLLLDIIVDIHSTFSVWLWARFVLLSSCVLINIALLVAEFWTRESEIQFISICCPLTVMRDSIMRGALVSYLYRADTPRSIITGAEVYFVVCSCLLTARLYGWFIAGRTLQLATALNFIAVIAQIGLLVQCSLKLKEIRDTPDLLVSVYFAMFGLASTGIQVLMFALFSTHFGLPTSMINFVVVLCAFFLSKIWHREDHVNVRDLLKAKREFVRYIAHEMRTPLNVTVVGVELALSQCAQTNVDMKRLREVISDTHVSLEVVMDTLNEFLVFDKVESGTLMLDKEIFLVLPVLEFVFKSFFLQAQEKNLKYALDSGSDLNEVCVYADKKKVTQAMGNFISNALKFTPATGSVTVKAYLTRSTCIPMFRFEVADTGAGIAPANVPRLFHEVVQFDAAKLQNGGGSGLGLTITKAIVVAHGGDVGVNSVLHEGSVFYLELETCDRPPLLMSSRSFSWDDGSNSFGTDKRSSSSVNEADSSDTLTVPSSGLFTSGTLSDFTKIATILLVDDSKLNLKMMKRLCDAFANNIITAVNGAEAVDIVKTSLVAGESGRIAAILSDYHMPVMDGIYMTSHVRAAGYDGFIALVTGDDNVAMSQFHASGGNMILSKPLSMNSIARMFLEISKDHRTKIQG